MAATDRIDALVRQLLAVRSQMAAMEAVESQMVADVKAAMAGAYRVNGLGYSISWKPSKPVTKTAWETVAASLTQALIERGMTRDDITTIVGLYTTTGEAARPFRVTTKGNDE